MALTKRLVKDAAITAIEHDENLDHVLARENHTGAQEISTVTGLQTALDGKQAAGSYAGVGHTHDLSDITTEGVMVRHSDWDASTGTFPGDGAAQNGYRYRVSAPGTINGVEFRIDDHLEAVTDDASTTIFSANWKREKGPEWFATDVQGDLAATAKQPNDPIGAQTVSTSRAIGAGDIGEVIRVTSAGVTITINDIGAAEGSTVSFVTDVGGAPNFTIASGTATGLPTSGYAMTCSTDRAFVTVYFTGADRALVGGGLDLA